MLCIRDFWSKTFSGGDCSQLRISQSHVSAYVTSSIITAASYTQVLICSYEVYEKYWDEKSRSVLFCFHK